ncbi:MAG: MotA/TolQ/ExbB proton channel family protein [Thermoleophilaceae bacterium]|nr:MotA/TolQ/ExbB proton channel family protein [Thermoleophilaceae bacterium]
MAASDAISQALSGLAGALDVPVHLAALFLLGLLAVELGRLTIEGWRRVRPGTPRLQELTQRALADADAAPAIARRTPGPLAERTVIDLAAATRSGGEAIEYALADFELSVQRRLDRTRMLVRAGPAVGLMGTLIPLAPGLTVLGEGDFAPLASDLKVAFAATVLGILVGTLAFALTLVRTRLYTEDLAAFERAVAAYDPQAGPHQRVTAAVGEHSA